MQMHMALHKTFPVDLVRFIEEILNRKLHFLCSEESIMAVKKSGLGEARNNRKVNLVNQDISDMNSIHNLSVVFKV